jgi:hypothetical protein
MITTLSRLISAICDLTRRDLETWHLTFPSPNSLKGGSAAICGQVYKIALICAGHFVSFASLTYNNQPNLKDSRTYPYFSHL